MYCSNCGKELIEGAKFCPNCAAQVGQVSNQSQDNQKEIVIKEGLCNRVKSKLYVQNGHGLLTNKRFIYAKHSLAKIAVMGVLVNLTKGDYDFAIPISEIVSLSEGKQGVSKTIIINTKSGKSYNFYFNDRQRWIIEFNNLIANN
jgi:hypothetical protein